MTTKGAKILEQLEIAKMLVGVEWGTKEDRARQGHEEWEYGRLGNGLTVASVEELVDACLMDVYELLGVRPGEAAAKRWPHNYPRPCEKCEDTGLVACDWCKEWDQHMAGTTCPQCKNTGKVACNCTQGQP